PPCGQCQRNRRHGGRCHSNAEHLRVRAVDNGCRRRSARRISGHWRAAEVSGSAKTGWHQHHNRRIRSYETTLIMPNFISVLSQSSNLIIYVFIAVAVMLAVEALGLSLTRRQSYRSRINRRLQLLEAADDRQAALIELRRGRGLSEEG